MSAGQPASAFHDPAQPGLFPTQEQRLVLRAALGDGAEAVGAYKEWLASLDITAEFDRGVFRLIPLLYDNLRRLGHQDELTGRLKGAYRMAWARNHRLFEETRPILETLLNAGLKVMAVKGAPIALQYYGNPALRPMADVDLVVPSDQAETAVRLVQGLGFVPWKPFDLEIKRYRHALALYAPGPREFDLHWHMLFDFCDERTDELFWRTAQPFEFLGRRIWAPDATRMLLHTIIHGLRWNNEPPVRWIPDAVMILRSAGGSVDWPAIVEFAETGAVTQRLHMGLSYIAGNFGAGVPASVLDRLARNRPRFAEVVERRTILRPISYESAMGPLLEALAEFPGLRSAGSPLAALNDFSHFLRFHWGLGGRREIPGRIASGMLRRARRGAAALGNGHP